YIVQKDRRGFTAAIDAVVELVISVGCGVGRGREIGLAQYEAAKPGIRDLLRFGRDPNAVTGMPMDDVRLSLDELAIDLRLGIQTAFEVLSHFERMLLFSCVQIDDGGRVEHALVL